MLVQSDHVVELGPMLRLHQAGADVWVALVLGVVLMIMGLLTLPLGAYGQPAWSMAASLLGLGLIALWWRKRKNHVRVYEEGLLYRRYNALYAIRWADITQVWQRVVSRSVNFIPVGTFYEYTLRTTDGTFVLKGDLSRVRELGEEIQRRTYRAHIRVAVEALRRGEALHFGPIQLSLAGIGCADRLLPWYEVRDLRVRNGDFLILGTGKWMSWATVSIAEVPNFMMLWALASERLGRRPDA